MDFRHLIVTCLFSMLRLSFETQKIKENYAILIIERVIASYYQPMNNSLKKNLSILLHSTKWHIVQGTAAG